MSRHVLKCHALRYHALRYKGFARGLSNFLLLCTLICLGNYAHAQGQRPANDSSDEAGLWYAVDKIELQVQSSGLRVTDPKLVDYAQRVTCKVTGPDCDKIRLYIIDAPYFNASMYPNGMMLLNSGLLLRAENEAQLSCVIGHEYGHFIEEHSLQQWRRAKSMANASIVLQIIGGAAGVGNETSLGTRIGSLLAQLGFSREQEREADTIGFNKAAEAGYDTSACSEVWMNIISETQSSTFKKVRKRTGKTTVLSSHPGAGERADTLAQMADSRPGGTRLGEAEHKAATQSHFSKWLATELLAKDYDRHIHLFEALKNRGRDSATADYYIGEAYRLRKGEGDKARAFKAWEAAAKGANPPPQVWRALGEQYRRKKMNAEALGAYQKYLNQSPNAPDRALIQAYVTRLSP